MAANAEIKVPVSTTSIVALPSSTVRQIGSSQVLVDPSSVVKELIDNALDARATAIVVEIASNSIDTIHVRDNGHGIPAEDRPLICRRYCTSKIRKYDDLKDVGGKWLGFRGEALASMAEMSGSLGITTRVEGEPVAVLVKYGRNGEVESTDRASHPVGTTVKVTDFFKFMPVRKQDALKHSAKWLAKVKRTLQAYALARPTVRFQLRILKAKNEKGNFTYAPKTGANVEDAAFKVIGRDCASQCDWTVLDIDGYEICAFLPKPGASTPKISSEGAFISIDSRPVSSIRGTSKKIFARFKEKLRKANRAFASVKDPFICLNIVCPPDSYDPNIEPAKDDVLFTDEGRVLAVLDKLLSAYYPEPIEAQDEPPTSGQRTIEHDADILSSSAQPSGETLEDTDFSPRILSDNSIMIDQDGNAENYDLHQDKLIDLTAQNRRHQWRSTMYGIDEEDLDLLSEDQPPIIEEEEGRRNVEVSNPWTIAKMNAPVRPKISTGHSQLMTPAKSQGELSMPSSSPSRPRRQRREVPMEPLTPHTLSRENILTSPSDLELMQNIQRLPRRGLPLENQAQIHEQGDYLPRTRQSSLPPSDMNPSTPGPTSLSRPFSASALVGEGNATSHYRSPLTGLSVSTSADIFHPMLSTPRRGRDNRQQYGYQSFSSPLRQGATNFENVEDKSDYSLTGSSKTRGGAVGKRKKDAFTPFQPLSFRSGDRSRGLQREGLDAAELAGDKLTSENNTDIREFFGQRNRQQQRIGVSEQPIPGSRTGSNSLELPLGASSNPSLLGNETGKIHRQRLQDEDGPTPGLSDIAAFFPSSPGPKAPERPQNRRTPTGIGSSFTPINTRSQHISDELPTIDHQPGITSSTQIADEFPVSEREITSPALAPPPDITKEASSKQRPHSTTSHHTNPQESHLQRRKSTHRPRSIKRLLSHTPPTYRTNNLILTLSPPTSTLSSIQRRMRKLDMGTTANSLEWGYPTIEWVGVFSEPVVEERVKRWCEVVDGMMDEWFERREGVNVVGGLIEGVMRGLGGIGVGEVEGGGVDEEGDEMII